MYAPFLNFLNYPDKIIGQSKANKMLDKKSEKMHERSKNIV